MVDDVVTFFAVSVMFLYGIYQIVTHISKVKDQQTDLKELIKETKTPLPKVELLPAFVFNCEVCGSENFLRGLCVSKETIEQLQPDFWKTTDIKIEGVFMMAPNFPVCESCGQVHQGMHYQVGNDVEALDEDDDTGFFETGPL